MENKYYTPSIEEFFVGFEYEELEFLPVKDPHFGIKIKKNIFAEHIWKTGYSNWQFLDNLKDGKIRVKYLDSSDIEEFLNIKPKLGESYIFLKDVNFRPNWLIGVYAHKIRIFFNPLTKWLKVEYLLTGNEEFEKFFEGSVKNKSEFIKLLRFLGYE